MDKSEQLEHYTQLAHQAIEKDDWAEATKLWQKIIDKFADSAPADAWLWLMRSYAHEGELDKAEHIAAKSLKKHHSKSKLLVLAAKIAVAQENWQPAIERWEEVIELLGDKSPAIAWTNLAKAQRMLHKLKKAEITAKAGLAKQGRSAGILIELAEISAAKKEWPLALNLWSEALDLINKMPSPNIPIKQHVRFNISVLNRLTKIDDYKRLVREYSKDQTPKRIAIVTSFTRGYDTLKPPEVLDKRFKYIAYTNESLDGLGVFDVRPLPKPELDDGRAIRYVKTHPHTLLNEYAVVVWVDASLMIVGDIYPLIERFIKSNMAIGSGVHPLRKDIYEEFEANVDRKKEDRKIMKRQVDFYKSKGFQHNDLAENTLLMFNIKHEKLAPALETWWEQISRFSKRDQLSFNYSLAQNQTGWFRLTKPPKDIRNHPGFVITAHHTSHQVLDELVRAIR